MKWNLEANRPIFTQLVEIIQKDIASGALKPEEKLQSVRSLAAEAKVNPNTVQKAYRELERMGLVHSKRTSGKFVTEDKNVIEELRKRIAWNTINTFFGSMGQLGFTRTEALSLAKILEKT